MMPSISSRSDELLLTLQPYENIAFVTHDNPDPDALSSGWALKWLVEQTLHRPARLLGAGSILRAENRHMVRLLRVPVELVDDHELASPSAAVLVDCGKAASNHALSRIGLKPVGVIDHHSDWDQRGQEFHCPFEDLRREVAATATIAASYLAEQHLRPPGNLATALLYAIRTETRGGQSFHSSLDRRMISWLTEFAEPSLLAEIEDAPLSRSYYTDLVLALQNTFVHDHVAICFLPSAQGAETVGEMADLLLRCAGVQTVLCATMIKQDMIVSLRTAPQGPHAAKLVGKLLEDLGQGGGHDGRAGGKIPDAANFFGGRKRLESELKRRICDLLDVRHQRGVRLISKKEIISNLNPEQLAC